MNFMFKNYGPYTYIIKYIFEYKMVSMIIIVFEIFVDM